MSWIIFGAARGLGALVLERAIASQQSVVAFIRNQNKAQQLQSLGVRVIVGDASDKQAVSNALQLVGSDATIISTMGGEGANYDAHRLIIDTASDYQIKRMLLITSIGCGNSWPTLSVKAKAAFGQTVREKSLAEIWLQTSTLDYCILRPGGLLNGVATGSAICYPCDQEVHGLVNRSDVALEIEKRLQQPQLGCCTLSIIDPSLPNKNNN